MIPRFISRAEATGLESVMDALNVRFVATLSKIAQVMELNQKELFYETSKILHEAGIAQTDLLDDSKIDSKDMEAFKI